MLSGLKPIMLLAKLPIPIPFEVWLPEMVGLADVLQQTPRAATESPPSEVIFPPLSAEEVVIEETAVVLTIGAVVEVVNVRSAP